MANNMLSLRRLPILVCASMISPLIIAGAGVAAGSGNLTLTPSSANFGNEAVGGTSVNKIFTVKNVGSIAVTMDSIGISGSFTGFSDCPDSLAAGDSCTVTLSFRPTTTGTSTGTLSINDSASGSPQTATLSGTGTN
jgi:hypothetical protein